jgi:preprotein translocase subunit YajC
MIAASSGSGFFLIIIIAFLLLWLIVVRPQRKRQSQQQEMLQDLRVGDEVLTAGGIYGTISGLDEHEVTVEIAPKTEVKVARRAIAGVTREPEEGEENELEDSTEPERPEEPDEATSSPQHEGDPAESISGGETSVEGDRG